MALIPDQKEFISSVGIIVAADMGVRDLAFPMTTLHTGKEITYDMAVVKATTVDYNSFAKTSNTMVKDGKSIVTIAPVNLNNSISKDEIDANATKFGQDEYGNGTIDPVMESALKGVGKIRLSHLATTKKIIYEALTTHKIVGGYENSNGKQDIVFAVPAANKVVLDNTAGHKYWSDTTNATPMDNIAAANDAMVVKPSFIIMNSTTVGRFLANAQVVKTALSTTAVQNYFPNMEVDPSARFYRIGRLMDGERGLILDLYVERESKSDNTPYMPTEYVVLGSPIGEMNFGGIPISEAGGVRNIVTEWDARELVTNQDPPEHKILVRTAPLPTLKNGEGYYSLRVEA